MAKEKIRIVTSTQKCSEVESVGMGMIVDKKGRNVVVIEVSSVPFFLYSPKRQRQIFESFRSSLSSFEGSFQIKSISTKTDLSGFLEFLAAEKEKEEDEECLVIYDEYKNKVLHQKENSFSRRNFIIFEVGKRRKDEDIKATAHYASLLSSRIIAALNDLGNSARRLNDEELVEFLFLLDNPDECFEERKEKTRRRYLDDQRELKDIPIREYFAPKTIEFKNRNILKKNEDYLIYSIIPSDGYPLYVSPGWLSTLLNDEHCDIDIFVSKKERSVIYSRIRKNINYATVYKEDSLDNTDAFDTSSRKLDAARYLKEGLSSGDDYYEMSFLVSTRGKSREKAEENFENLRKKLLEEDIVLKRLNYLNKEGYASSFPLAFVDSKIEKRSHRNVLSGGIASLYPFTSYEISDEEGIYLGDDLLTSSMMIADIYNSERFNSANIFIAGESGSGKTYTLLLLALRMRLLHIPVFIIAPEKEDEFKRVCHGLNGQFIEIGEGSESFINIMEIRKPSDKAMSTKAFLHDERSSISLLSQKITSLRRFFEIFDGSMSIEEKQILDDAIIKTYARFGISEDNDSIYQDERHDELKKMPLIADLQETLSAMKGARRLFMILNYFVKGSGKIFNHQSNVNPDQGFTVIGLERLSRENQPLGIYLIMDLLWSIIKEDPTQKKALFIDEWWKWAIHPISAEYSMEIAKTIRSYSGAMILSSQQLSDIFALDEGKYGSAIFGNCPIRIFLKMEENDAHYAAKLSGLSEREREHLQRFKRGQALFVSSDIRMALYFNATKREHDLITTDRRELLRIEKEKKEEKRMRNMKTMINASLNLNEILLDDEGYISEEIREKRVFQALDERTLNEKIERRFYS